MSLGYEEEVEVGLDAVAVSDAVAARRVSAVTTALSYEPQVPSAPPGAAMRSAARCTARTTAPLLIADLISIAIAGLIAYLVIHFCFPDAARTIARVAPIALMPLI